MSYIKKGNHGGARKGAGKKPGQVGNHTLQAQETKALLIQMFQERAQPIFDKLLEKAEDGDIQAIKEIMDRVYGKAPQSMDVTSKGVTVNMTLTDEQRIKLAMEQLNAAK